MEQTKEIKFKICKTCNAAKEIAKYRAYAKECKQCTNKKDYENSIRRKKEHYKRNRERIIKHNTEYYYIMKQLKESNIEPGICT